MEFFRIVRVETDEKALQDNISFDHIEEISNHIFRLSEPNQSELSIGSIWGEFTLIRQSISSGLRFALKECPNALAWTITTDFPPERNGMGIHLTINRERKDSEFIEEIEEFLDDHSACLQKYFSNLSANNSGTGR